MTEEVGSGGSFSVFCLWEIKFFGFSVMYLKLSHFSDRRLLEITVSTACRGVVGGTIYMCIYIYIYICACVIIYLRQFECTVAGVTLQTFGDAYFMCYLFSRYPSSEEIGLHQPMPRPLTKQRN